MNEISIWIRVVVGIVSIVGTLVGFGAWVWKLMQRQAGENAEAIEKVEEAVKKRFDEFERELGILQKEMSHRATHEEIARVHERLSGIEANQKGINNILGVIHQHILRNG